MGEVSSGGAVINDTILHVGNHYLPFGGVGHSGIGAYHGKYGFDTFSHEKSILKKPMFFGGGATIHQRIREKMFEILYRNCNNNIVHF